MGCTQHEFTDRRPEANRGAQALATCGTFFVALIGIRKVVPIITNQAQQQAVGLVSTPVSVTEDVLFAARRSQRSSHRSTVWCVKGASAA